MFFVISGPSGVGKSSIIEKLLAFFSDFTYIKTSISYTTRPPRKRSDGTLEIHGIDYYFVGEDEFNRLKESGELLESTCRYNAQYGTGKAELARLKNLGYDVLLDLDVIGGLKVKELYPESTKLIFIEPPSLAELEKRLYTRASGDDIEARMADAKEQIYIGKQKYDYVVTNTNLSSAVREVANRIINPILSERLARFDPEFEEAFSIPLYGFPEKCIIVPKKKTNEQE